MQLQTPINTYGNFWLVNKPDDRLPGILNITIEGAASLDLFGTFKFLQNDSGSDWQLLTEKLHILGATNKLGAVTLIDCFIVNHNQVRNIELLSKFTIDIGRVFGRTHFETEEPCFFGMTFSVEGLDEWFAFYHRPFSSEGDPFERMSITYSKPDSIIFDIPDNFTISFNMGVETESAQFQETVTSRMNVCIESSQMRPFSDFLYMLIKVKNFLSFVIDRTVSFTSITGDSQDPDNQSTSGTFPIPVEIYGRFDPYDLPKADVRLGNVLISFDALAHNIQDCLSRWLTNYEEYEPTFNLYFLVMANRYMHLEGGFLFLVNGIESLHRRSSTETRMPPEEFHCLRDTILQNTPDLWKRLVDEKLKYANELSLRSRIKQMIEPFGDLFGSNADRNAFVNRVVNTRNYLTHYDNSIKDQAVTDPRKLLQLRFKLEALVQLHLLYCLGVEHDHIDALARQYSPLKSKLRI